PTGEARYKYGAVPPMGRLTRHGRLLAMPCPATVDGVDVEVVATLDRVCIVQFSDGTETTAPIQDVVLYAPPTWRQGRPMIDYMASRRGRRAALASRFAAAPLDQLPYTLGYSDNPGVVRQ